MEATATVINQFLDYVSTYPNDVITYRSINMRLVAHYDAAYINFSKACSRAGAHIFLSKEDPKSRHNGPILTISQIVKFFMSSVAEAELAALFIISKYMVPLCQTLIEVKWPQGKPPIQTNNSTVVGVTSNTIVPKRTNSMDMRFHWLRCRMAHGKFRF